MNAIESISIAYQDAQSSLRSRSWNLNGNLTNQALAAIGANNGLNHNLVAGPSFGHIGTRRFQARGAAFADKIEIELHSRNVGHVESIGINAAKAIADGGRSHGGRGLSIVLRRKNVLQGNVGIAPHAQHAIHAVSNIFAIFVGAMQRIKNGGG